jgi:hypothetical protein
MEAEIRHHTKQGLEQDIIDMLAISELTKNKSKSGKTVEELVIAEIESSGGFETFRINFATRC